MDRAGIAFEDKSALIAKLSSQKKILSLKKIAKHDVKQLDILSKTFLTSAALPAGLVLIKTTEIKTLNKWLLKKNLNLQKEIITVLPKEEALSIVRIGNQNKEKTSLIFQITKKKHLQTFLEQFDPQIAISLEQALKQFALFYFPQEPDINILHFGEKQTTCISLKAKELHLSYSIDIGLNDISSKEGQTIETLPLDKRKLLDQLSLQINNVLSSFQELQKPVLITGQTGLLKHLDLFILSKNKEEISSLLLPKNEELQTYAAAVGAALETFESRPMQFRYGSFFSKRLIQKAYQKIALAGLGFLALTGLFYWQGSRFLEKQKKQLMENFQTLFSIQTNSLNDLERKIELLEKNEKLSPFYVSAPKVSTVLNWLSKHPLLSQKEIEVTNFKYELISFPKIGSLQKNYQAKVNITFKTENSILARQIRANLQKGDQLVANKPELDWQNSENLYRTTFYLHNLGKNIP